jgi:hypothetical protein
MKKSRYYFVAEEERIINIPQEFDQFAGGGANAVSFNQAFDNDLLA